MDKKTQELYIHLRSILKLFQESVEEWKVKNPGWAPIALLDQVNPRIEIWTGRLDRNSANEYDEADRELMDALAEDLAPRYGLKVTGSRVVSIPQKRGPLDTFVYVFEVKTD